MGATLVPLSLCLRWWICCIVLWSNYTHLLLPSLVSNGTRDCFITTKSAWCWTMYATELVVCVAFHETAAVQPTTTSGDLDECHNDMSMNRKREENSLGSQPHHQILQLVSFLFFSLGSKLPLVDWLTMTMTKSQLPSRTNVTPPGSQSDTEYKFRPKTITKILPKEGKVVKFRRVVQETCPSVTRA